MAYYLKHMKNGSKDGKEKHYLILGPFDNAGTWNPKKELCNLYSAIVEEMIITRGLTRD